MNRRTFLLASASAALLSSCKVSFEQGMKNPCADPAKISPAHMNSKWVREAWAGINPANVWDVHTHLYGDGDSGSGLWLHPDLAESRTLMGRVQRTGYLNAGCVIDVQGERDRSMRARLTQLADAMPPGFKSLVFAFDYAHDERGARVPEHSTFYVPDSYARDVAKARPDRFEWVASVHPYRADARDALQRAKAEGARAVKWLPAAQGMNPSHSLCAPAFRTLAELNLPLIIHAGKELAVKGPDTQSFGNPLRLRAALDAGVRVIVAHAASLGDDIDLDVGENGPRVDAFALWLRMMDDARYTKNLFADLSATAQMNRMDVLPTLLRRTDLHARFLNGSDYPLPGVMPLYSLNKIVDAGLLDAEAVPTLRTLREHNALLFDFVLKRSLAFEGKRFAVGAFETRGFFAA
jgi:uncharacterized protein